MANPLWNQVNTIFQFSHSGNLVVLSYSQTRNHGVDIQAFNPKIARIVSKFVNEDELAFTEEYPLMFKLNYFTLYGVLKRWYLNTMAPM
jgi:phosphopantetheinyl transferase